MKILAVVSTLDLKYRLGCTPAWWQLFKAMSEVGSEVIAIPYLGDPVESLWWKTYANPFRWQSVAYNSYLEKIKKRGESPSKRNLLSPGFDFIIQHYIRPRWRSYLTEVLEKEQDVRLVMFMNVPMNHISGIPSEIKRRFKIPVIYYDGDMPTSLPKYTVGRGFKFDYYQGANLGEYDALLANSEGCLKDLKEMGAKKVFPLHYGIDPQTAIPVQTEKDLDVTFFGYGSDFREEWMNKLITGPSKLMPDVKFAVAGGGFKIDLGKAELYGDLSYSAWKRFCSRSKICLNITRWSHTNVFASSTSRPFELAAYGACIVSQPYNGLEKWFSIGDEMLVVNSQDEAIATYRRLLQDKTLRDELGARARSRVLAEHTFVHRAKELEHILENL